MNITVAEQLRGFCFALGMGLFLGILYDGFRLLRLFWRPPRRQQFFLDVFCMLLMGLFTFMLALAVSSGQLRMYVLVGEGVGFFPLCFNRRKGDGICGEMGWEISETVHMASYCALQCVDWKRITKEQAEDRRCRKIFL